VEESEQREELRGGEEVIATTRRCVWLRGCWVADSPLGAGDSGLCSPWPAELRRIGARVVETTVTVHGEELRLMGLARLVCR
jgi:hypothetical protein